MVHERPREEWIEIPVPALVSEEQFEQAQEQLEANKRHATRRTKEPTLLEAGQETDPQRRRLAELQGERERLERAGVRLVTAYQEELIGLDELRSRMPAIRLSTPNHRAARAGD